MLSQSEKVNTFRLPQWLQGFLLFLCTFVLFLSRPYFEVVAKQKKVIE